jgi:hypothetical protein
LWQIKSRFISPGERRRKSFDEMDPSISHPSIAHGEVGGYSSMSAVSADADAVLANMLVWTRF